MTAPEDQPATKVSAALPSYALEDEEAAAGWRKWIRGRRLAFTLGLFALIAAITFGAKPLYREAKARRALSIAAQAGAALDRGENAEASRLLRQAALMAFEDKRVAALVTFHAARAGDMASVAELGEKLSRQDASAGEILVFGEMSLRAGRLADAARAADALPDTDAMSADEGARTVLLRTGIFRMQGRVAEAKNALRAALAANTGEASDGLRVALAGLLLDEKAPDSAREAERLLEDAARNQGEPGAAALRLLCASRAGLAPEARRDFERAAERLRGHPAVADEDEIFLARLAASVDPSRLEDIAADLVKRLRSGRIASIDTRVAAARWLVGEGRLAQALELVDEEEVAKHAGALMVRLDALSGLEDWDQTSRLIENNRGGTLSDTLYHLFRARVAAVRGDETGAEEEKRQLRQTMTFAEIPHVLFAARYAETVGWKPEALAAWRVLAADEGARPEAIRGQLRNLPANAPAAEGLALASELLALRPDDPSARISAAYFRLLANEDVEKSAALAEEFVAANPASTDLQRVAALGRLRAGHAQQALAIWPGESDENRWRALHVALLRANGRLNEAQREAEEIDAEALSPEERDFLSGREN